MHAWNVASSVEVKFTEVEKANLRWWVRSSDIWVYMCQPPDFRGTGRAL